MFEIVGIKKDKQEKSLGIYDQRSDAEYIKNLIIENELRNTRTIAENQYDKILIVFKEGEYKE